MIGGHHHAAEADPEPHADGHAREALGEHLPRCRGPSRTPRGSVPSERARRSRRTPASPRAAARAWRMFPAMVKSTMLV